MSFNVVFPGAKQQSEGVSLPKFYIVDTLSLRILPRSIAVLCLPTLRIYHDIWENKKQDSQCTYSITLRRVRVTSGKVAANIMSGSPYPCLSHSACKSHLLCAVLLSPVACLVILYFFSTLSHKRKGLKRSLNMECVFLLFSTTFIWKIYYSKNNSAVYYHQFT